MTNEEWAAKIVAGALPPRPAWTQDFRAPALERRLDPPRRKRARQR